MAKKIALALIMVLLINIGAWAQETDYGFLENPWFIAGVCALIFIPLIIWASVELFADADAPDDGLRLASMQTFSLEPQTAFSPKHNFEPETGVGVFLNVLQHIEVGQTKDNKIYAGVRFWF